MQKSVLDEIIFFVAYNLLCSFYALENVLNLIFHAFFIGSFALPAFPWRELVAIYDPKKNES